jgi:predicted dehydrogenase
MEIAVIGTGQIGSRHLQSLAGISSQHTLHAVDPSPDSERVVRERLGNLADRVVFHAAVGTLPHSLEAVVIATSATVRRQCMTDLLAHGRVRYAILEKILFPSVSDCLWAEGQLAQHGVKAWVNFPRRMQAVYQKIQAEAVPGTVRDIRVSGSRWGLATSAVHFLDLVLFLAHARSLTVESLQASTFDSPRHRNCIEADGVLAGSTDSGASYSIVSWDTGNAPIQVTVETVGKRWSITERDNQALVRESETGQDWQPADWSSPLLYQSQLSGPVVEELFATAGCRLTDYSGALQSHLPLLRAWNRQLFPQSDPDLTSCPIT